MSWWTQTSNFGLLPPHKRVIMLFLQLHAFSWTQEGPVLIARARVHGHGAPAPPGAAPRCSHILMHVAGSLVASLGPVHVHVEVLAAQHRRARAAQRSHCGLS